MKANAPEKLYISPTAFEIGEKINHILTAKSKGDIEYIRTDAFIEKASSFLCECIEDCMARYMETWSIEMKTKTIDNFKKYMKQ